MKLQGEKMPEYANETKPKNERLQYIKKTLLTFGEHPRLLNKSAVARKLGVSHTQVCDDIAVAKKQLRENRNINDLDVSEDFREWLLE